MSGVGVVVEGVVAAVVAVVAVIAVVTVVSSQSHTVGTENHMITDIS